MEIRQQSGMSVSLSALRIKTQKQTNEPTKVSVHAGFQSRGEGGSGRVSHSQTAAPPTAQGDGGCGCCTVGSLRRHLAPRSHRLRREGHFQGIFDEQFSSSQ